VHQYRKFSFLHVSKLLSVAFNHEKNELCMCVTLLRVHSEILLGGLLWPYSDTFTIYINFYRAPLRKRGICCPRVSVCLFVCLCVCLSHSGIVSKRLNIGSRNKAIAQGL